MESTFCCEWASALLISPIIYWESGAKRASIFLVAETVKNLPAMLETQVWPLDQEAPLEKGMATHSSMLAWRSPWTEEPGGVAKSWDTTKRLTLTLPKVLEGVQLGPTRPASSPLSECLPTWAWVGGSAASWLGPSGKESSRLTLQLCDPEQATSLCLGFSSAVWGAWRASSV